MNLKTAFSSANVTLDVVARSMKKGGIAVFLRTKTGSEKAVLGCRTIHKDESAALTEYERLLTDVKAKGWVMGESKVGSTGRFTEVPVAPTAPVATSSKADKAAPAAPAKMKQVK